MKPRQIFNKSLNNLHESITDSYYHDKKRIIETIKAADFRPRIKICTDTTPCNNAACGYCLGLASLYLSNLVLGWILKARPDLPSSIQRLMHNPDYLHTGIAILKEQKNLLNFNINKKIPHFITVNNIWRTSSHLILRRKISTIINSVCGSSRGDFSYIGVIEQNMHGISVYPGMHAHMLIMSTSQEARKIVELTSSKMRSRPESHSTIMNRPVGGILYMLKADRKYNNKANRYRPGVLIKDVVWSNKRLPWNKLVDVDYAL